MSFPRKMRDNEAKIVRDETYGRLYSAAGYETNNIFNFNIIDFLDRAHYIDLQYTDP